MAPGGKPSCLTTLPAVRHCQSQCEPTDSQTHLQSGGDLRCPDLGQSAWETGGESPMHGLRGNGAREKTALMPDPLRRSSFGFTTLDSRRGYGHGAPEEGPVGTLPQSAALGSPGLMDLCGRFRPVGPPRSSCDAYVGRVCHCHCGSDRRSRHPVRLVWVKGSFGCRTIAARTRDWILDTIPVVTNNYSTIPVSPWVVMGNLTRDQPAV